MSVGGRRIICAPPSWPLPLTPLLVPFFLLPACTRTSPPPLSSLLVPLSRLSTSPPPPSSLTLVSTFPPSPLPFSPPQPPPTPPTAILARRTASSTTSPCDGGWHRTRPQNRPGWNAHTSNNPLLPPGSKGCPQKVQSSSCRVCSHTPSSGLPSRVVRVVSATWNPEVHPQLSRTLTRSNLYVAYCRGECGGCGRCGVRKDYDRHTGIRPKSFWCELRRGWVSHIVST